MIKVVLTNHTSGEYRELVHRLGADRFFDKSLETSEAMRFIASQAESKNSLSRRAREDAAEPAHS
jgi:DNA-binding NarL/FixJ family response regulator